MRSAIAFVAAAGAAAGVAAQTNPADCQDNWTSSCDSSLIGFVSDPRIQHLDFCTADSDCINDGLTNCGPGFQKEDDGTTLTQVWLTAAGDLNPVIDNDLWSTKPTFDAATANTKNTCGIDSEQVLYQDPLKKVTNDVTNADGSTTQVDINQYTGCYANEAGQEQPAGMPTGNPAYPTSRPVGVNSCRVTEAKGAPTCRCRNTPASAGGESQCKALYDAAQTSDFNAARFRAFKTKAHQCVHFTPQTCASTSLCKYAGPNINKECKNAETCRSNNDPDTDFTVAANKLIPGTANERCACEVTQCQELWGQWQTKFDLRQTALDAGQVALAESDANFPNDINNFDAVEAEMVRLENAGQCVGLRPGSNPTTTPKPEYSMHIGLVAGIAAGSVALAALITSALVCILMYACRTESHVQTQARNQRAMAMGGGQSAVVYGRSGAEMEMTRRSRY